MSLTWDLRTCDLAGTLARLPESLFRLQYLSSMSEVSIVWQPCPFSSELATILLGVKMLFTHPKCMLLPRGASPSAPTARALPEIFYHGLRASGVA